MATLSLSLVLRKHKIAVLSSLCCFSFGILTGRASLPFSSTAGQPNGDVAPAPPAPASLRSRNDHASYKFKLIDTDVADDALHANRTTLASVTTDADKESVVFFHVHIMKTAGSSLNRYLARRYHSVCGHKGYSYDQPFILGEPRMNEPGGFGPDRVEFSEMKERGWHNCRLISHETDSDNTIRILKDLKEKGFKVRTLIPCRDPVSHCISKLSHVRFKLELLLDSNALCDVINAACSRIQSNRFSNEILSVADESSFFWYTNFSRVDELISSYVPRRTFQLPDADRKFEMNKPFPDDVVRDVVKKCGRSMHDFFMKKPYYHQCSRRIEQVDQIPQ